MHLRLSLPITKLLFGLGICSLGFLVFANAQYDGNDYCNQGDLMQQAFCEANRRQTIIDAGNTTTAVGTEILKGGQSINVKWKKSEGLKFGFSRTDSIVVRITRFFLMLTIVLAVTMVIYNGFLYITMTGSGEDPKKAQTNLMYIVIGIIIALFSVVIINLLRSAGTTLYKQASSPVSTVSTSITSDFLA